MRRHLLPLRSCLLSAGRFRRENRPLHHDPSVSDNVLPSHFGNHPLHLSGAAASRQISLVHHGAGRAVRRHYDFGTQRPLQETEHSQDEPMRAESVHTVSNTTHHGNGIFFEVFT